MAGPSFLSSARSSAARRRFLCRLPLGVAENCVSLKTETEKETLFFWRRAFLTYLCVRAKPVKSGYFCAHVLALRTHRNNGY